MPGDKLKRVKSVKRWLDKAENSYSNNKDISGELNLMMAQAEMQRLKETHLVLSETVQPTVAATESSNTDPVPTKSIQTEAPAPVLPVMSQSEIQSVVGEAGRALRGQS